MSAAIAGRTSERMRDLEDREALEAETTGRRDFHRLFRTYPITYGDGPDGLAVPLHLRRGYAFWRGVAGKRGRGYGPEPIRCYLSALHGWQVYRAGRRVAYRYARTVLGLRGIAAVRFAEQPASRRPLSAALLVLDIAVHAQDWLKITMRTWRD